MEDINWEESFKNDRRKEIDFENEINGNHSSSKSYANQFSRLRQEEETFNGQTRQSSFRDDYTQAEQDRRHVPHEDRKSYGDAYQTRGSTTLKKEPTFQYNEKEDGGRVQSDWRFLDLKNKKQTGDVYKKILYYNKKNDHKVFNFVSSRGKEGTSTVVANLTDYINSQAIEKRILVIDANLQSPNLHKIFNISQDTYGLMDIFNNRIGVREAFTPISSNIFFLCCGNGNTKTNDSLDQENFLKLLNYCRQEFDYILVDCPPVLSSNDALSIAPAADLTFLIIRSGEVQRPVAEKAKTLLQNDECQIGGIILNRVQQVIPSWVYKFI